MASASRQVNAPPSPRTASLRCATESAPSAAAWMCAAPLQAEPCSSCKSPSPMRSRRLAKRFRMHEPRWLTIAREVRAIAQTGLAFTADGFDHQRYQRLRELAALLLAQGSASEHESIVELL